MDKFFDYATPDENGVEVDLHKQGCASEYGRDGESGIEIDVTKLPADVKVIRFVNSW